MPRRSRGIAHVLSATLILLAFAPVDSGAIPAFARKYRATCALCHAPVPRLNAFGEEFAGNGFVFVRGEAPTDTLNTGDPLLRYSLATSAVRAQRVTSTNVVSSTH